MLHPEDFEGEGFVSLAPLVEARTQTDALMLPRGVQRRLNIETQLSSAIIKLVEVGPGLSIIEPLTASTYMGGLLKFIQIESELVAGFSIVLSPRMSSTLILKLFIGHARREIREMVLTQLLVRS